MFILKKIIGALLSPGAVIFLFLCFGLLIIFFSKKIKRLGWFFLILGTISFYFFSTGPLPNALLAPLEHQYKPLQPGQDIAKIDYIVVLAGGLRDISNVPPTSQLSADTALRVVEGIRLFHLFSDQPTLIMSGGGKPSSGKMMVAFAGSLGVPADKLVAETRSLDTFGNAKEVKPIVKDAPFALVTSASHLPRSMIIFKILGMAPIPAPADFNIVAEFSWSEFLPSGDYLEATKAACHEYLGLAYLKLFPWRAGK